MFKEKITDFDNLTDSYRKASLGKNKFRINSAEFRANRLENLRILQDDLLSGNYQHSDYNSFMVREPKERLILAPKFRDKVVHHAINSVLRDYLEPMFISDSYACIRNKGTLAAIQKHFQNLKDATLEYQYPKVLHMDVYKFFYTIDRSILINILIKIISCSFTVDLLTKIINSMPGTIGLTLGNLTSQLLANIYLNTLDSYIKRTLGIKYYIRYADDIFLILPEHNTTLLVQNLVTNFLKQKLNLKVDPTKNKVYSVDQKHLVLGFLLSSQTIKLPYKKRQTLKNILQRENRQLDKDLISMVSYLSHVKPAVNINYIKSLINKNYLISNKFIKFKLLLDLNTQKLYYLNTGVLPNELPVYTRAIFRINGIGAEPGPFIP